MPRSRCLLFRWSCRPRRLLETTRLLPSVHFLLVFWRVCGLLRDEARPCPRGIGLAWTQGIEEVLGMKRPTVLILLVLTAALSGCDTTLRNLVGDNATSITKLTGASKPLLPNCRSGDATACYTIDQNLSAIDFSAGQMID